ncbi:MAG: hypothetical protein IPI93_03020 [Sphingobacteriaceae bacterium]|nr:hypothetical protein [Sphingobacteriaceae bacterium]MBK7818070.1 hypothetical protein [Sphingobacteriaceae bacterium]
MNVNLPELEKLTQEFPYFQTAHLLYAISSKRNDASAFQRSIKKTAIVAVSRNHLYELLYANKPVEIKEEVKPVKVESDVVILELPEDKKTKEVVVEEKKIETKKIDINEQVEREIQKDVVEAFVEKEILHTNTAHKKDIPMPVGANFAQWIKYIKQKNEGDVDETQVGEEKQESKKITVQDQQKKAKQKQLIDKIIDTNPTSIKLNKDTKFFVADQKAKESLLENEELVTETLAKIYALQGNVNKAIRSYQILSLKYPNKSAYFASLIEELRKDK